MPRSICSRPDGIAAYRAAARDAGNHSASFLEILVHHIKNRDQNDIPMRVAGEQAWLDAWSKNSRGGDAKPFVATNVSQWWRVNAPLESFTCSELSKIYSTLKADYQLHGRKYRGCFKNCQW